MGTHGGDVGSSVPLPTVPPLPVILGLWNGLNNNIREGVQAAEECSCLCSDRWEDSELSGCQLRQVRGQLIRTMPQSFHCWDCCSPGCTGALG